MLKISKIKPQIPASQRLQSLFLIALVMIVLGAFVNLLQSNNSVTGKAQENDHIGAEAPTATIWPALHEMSGMTYDDDDENGLGYNRDYWAIFATDSQGCDAPEAETAGPLTFVELDPVFIPPLGDAYANLHSNGSVTIGNHEPILGQVTYHSTCTNCENAIVAPEMAQYELTLPIFETYRTLALERADAEGSHLTGDIVWGGPLDQIGPDTLIPDGIWYIDGSLTIMSGTLAVTQNSFIYVSGDVNIDGFFIGSDLSILSDGVITINGTFRNTYPYPRDVDDQEFEHNRAVLWSNHDRSQSEIGEPCHDPVINITTMITNVSPFFSTINPDIKGMILAPYGRIEVKANHFDSFTRGTLIGDTVFVSSNPDTGAEAHVQHNANYFPFQPKPIAVLSLEPPTTTVEVGESFEFSLLMTPPRINDLERINAYLNFNPDHLQVASITPSYLIQVSLNEFDNALGHIDFVPDNGAAWIPTDEPQLLLATLTFTATGETDGTPLTFNFVEPRRSDAILEWYDGFSVLSRTIDSTIIITSDITPTMTPTITPTVTLTNTPTTTPTITATLTPTTTPTITATLTPTSTPTMTVTFTPTMTPTLTPTLTPSSTQTVMPTYTPTATVGTATPTLSPSPTDSPTLTAYPSPTETRFATRYPSPTATRTPTMTRTPTSSHTPTETPTLTHTPMPTLTPTSTPMPTSTPTPTPTATNNPTPTNSPTNTPTKTPTNTPTSTPTSTVTATSTPSTMSSIQLQPGEEALLISPDGDVELNFSANAVTMTTFITYTSETSPTQETGSFIFAGISFHVEASDMNGDSVITFNQPFTITLHYDDEMWQEAGIESEESLNLFFWDGNQWQNLLPCTGCSLDPDENRLTIILDHLTEFALLSGLNNDSHQIYLPLIRNH